MRTKRVWKNIINAAWEKASIKVYLHGRSVDIAQGDAASRSCAWSSEDAATIRQRGTDALLNGRSGCCCNRANVSMLKHEVKAYAGGFVIPAQPVMASKPPSGADWVHEIKHDGYRLIVRRDGAAVRLYTRNALDLTSRLPEIAAAAERINATSFTIDGEAVVLGPDDVSRFDELRRRAGADTAILYAFDLIEHDPA